MVVILGNDHSKDRFSKMTEIYEKVKNDFEKRAHCGAMCQNKANFWQKPEN